MLGWYTVTDLAAGALGATVFFVVFLAATLACLWEATAAKPGNVHRGADFEDMTAEDFARRVRDEGGHAHARIVLLSGTGVRGDAATGLAIGTASHGIGTARALQISDTAGAFSGLAMGLNALLTAIVLPIVWKIFAGG